MGNGLDIFDSHETSADSLILNDTKKETNDLLSGIFGKKFTDLLDKVSKVLGGISGAFGGNKENESTTTTTNTNTNVSEQINTDTINTVAENNNLKEGLQDRQQLALIHEYKGADKELFGNKIIQISNNLGINPNWLMAVIWKESTMNPKAINEKSGASGLIQFIPDTAKGLGTSVQKIRTMSAIDQLDYVEKYMKSYVSKIHSYEDTYLAVFYPKYLGETPEKKLPGYVIADNPGVGKTVGEFTDHYAYKNIPDDAKEKLV